MVQELLRISAGTQRTPKTQNLLLGSCKGEDPKHVVQVLPMKMITIFKSVVMDRWLFFTMIGIILKGMFLV